MDTKSRSRVVLEDIIYTDKQTLVVKSNQYACILNMYNFNCYLNQNDDITIEINHFTISLNKLSILSDYAHQGELNTVAISSLMRNMKEAILCGSDITIVKKSFEKENETTYDIEIVEPSMRFKFLHNPDTIDKIDKVPLFKD